MTLPVASVIDKLDVELGNNLLKCCGLRGGLLNLNAREGHFYRRLFKNNDDQLICADVQFLSLFAAPGAQKLKCNAMSGQLHSHPIPSRESVEVATLRWACKLRVIRYHANESIYQSVDNVRSSWPNGLAIPITTLMTSRFEIWLQRSQLEAKNNHSAVRAFLEELGDQTFSRFHNALFTLRYWNQPSLEEGSKLGLPSIPTEPQYRIPAKLLKIIKTSQAIRVNPACPEFNQQVFLKFEQTIVKYEQVLKNINNIKEDNSKHKIDVERAIVVAEHLFHQSRLEQWLRYKQNEMNITRTIVDTKGKVPIINKFQLEKQLSQTEIVEYVVILRIPSVSDWTRKTFETMKQFVKAFSEGQTSDNDYDLNAIIDDKGMQDVPWYSAVEKRKQVLDQIRQLANHVKRNQMLNYIKYSIIVSQNNKQFGSWFIIYEDGELLRDNISRLPEPPTELCVRLLELSKSNDQFQEITIGLEWKYEDIGYPGHFLIEYRNADTFSWKRVRTSYLDGLDQTRINFKYQRGLVMEFRVASETCIGRSQFSQIIDTRLLENDPNVETTEVVDFTENPENNKLKRAADGNARIGVSRSLKMPKLNIVTSVRL